MTIKWIKYITAILVLTVVTGQTLPSFATSNIALIDQTSGVTTIDIENSTIPKVIIEGVTTTNLAYGVELGTLNNTTGEENATENCVRTDVFRVEAGEVYSVYNSLEYHQFVYSFDSAGDFIARTDISNTGGLYTPEANAVSCRVRSAASYYENDLDVIYMFVHGDVLVNRPPFIIGTQDTSDLMIKRKGENLFDAEWNDNKSTSIDYALNHIVTNAGRAISEPFMVEAGKLYTRNTVNTAKTIYYAEDGRQLYYSSKNSTTTHETPLGTRWAVVEVDMSEPNKDSLMFVEGSTLPTQYIEPENNQVFISGCFGMGTKVTVEGSKAVVERTWSEPIELNSERFQWELQDNYSGFKRVRSVNELNNCIQGSNPFNGNLIGTKYNGKNMVYGTTSYSDSIGIGGNDNYLYLSISDLDSGWGEDYEPTPEEIEAYFNGWIMYGSSDNQPWTGSNGAKRWAKRYQGIGLQGSIPFAANESGTTSLICPAGKAYGDATEYYSLRYEFATPEEYTIDLSDSLNIKKGINHIFIRTGFRKESITALQSSDGYYKVNYIGSDKTAWSPLDKKPSSIHRCYYVDNGVEYDIPFLISKSVSASYGEEMHIYISESDITQQQAQNVQVIYETQSSEYDSGTFSATVKYDDSMSAVIDKLVEKSAAQDNEIILLKKLIMDMASNNGSGNITFEYDENGNLTNITTD